MYFKRRFPTIGGKKPYVRILNEDYGDVIFEQWEETVKRTVLRSLAKPVFYNKYEMISKSDLPDGVFGFRSKTGFGKFIERIES